MLTVESIRQKAADLSAQLEQHVGQINRINGAVAVLGDLIKEMQEAEQVAKATSATKEFLAFHDASMVGDPTHWGTHEGAAAAPDAPSLAYADSDVIDPLGYDRMFQAAAPSAPPLAPEMLPVRFDAELDA